MEEFLRNYGFLILFGIMVFFMLRRGGCCGGSGGHTENEKHKKVK
ncbi:MAG: hypothetical protein WA118_05185 [Carboxydocellales bacterium]|jgi:hypothetical protein